MTDEKRDVRLANLRPFDGPALTTLLAGKEVADVTRNNELLIIRMTSGDEIRVAWVDSSGKPVKGEPAIAFFGRNILAKTTSLSNRSLPLGNLR